MGLNISLITGNKHKLYQYIPNKPIIKLILRSVFNKKTRFLICTTKYVFYRF